MPILYDLVCEDELTEYIVKKILSFVNCGSIRYVSNRQGKENVLKSIFGYYKASTFMPTIVIVDLDNYLCVKNYVEEIISTYQLVISANFIFRVAVKEIESWILADLSGFRKFFKIKSKTNIPYIDQINNTKEFLLSSIQSSSSKTYRDQMLPEGTSPIGPLYNFHLSQFINSTWDLNSALERSESLKRFVAQISRSEAI